MLVFQGYFEVHETFSMFLIRPGTLFLLYILTSGMPFVPVFACASFGQGIFVTFIGFGLY